MAKRKNKNASLNLTLLLEALLVGVLAGFVVGFFRWGIKQTSAFWLHAFQLAHQNAWWLVAIAVGFIAIGFLAGWFVKQYPHVGGSGIPEVKLQMEGKLHLQWFPILWRKLIGGILVIGTGLFLGPEGPSLQLGSSLGQGVGEKTHQTPSNRRVLLATGAASGLAAAFGAPLSGALFVLEEIFHNFSPRVWLNALVGAIAANFVVSNIFGQHASLGIAYNHAFPLPYYWQLVLLGIVLGLLGHFYKWGLFAGKKINQKIKFLPMWLHGLIPLVLLMPIMYFLPLTTGPGNRLILSLPGMIEHAGSSLVLVQHLLITLVLYYLLRLFFSIISYDSGLPSGIFLPILTMGALLGASFGLLMVRLGLLPAHLVINLVIFAMAGAFAAVIRAPFTAIILITEMVGSLLHLMPLVVVSVFAILTDEFLGGRPIYGQLASLMVCEKEDGLVDQEGQLTISVFNSSQLVGKRVSEVHWPADTLVKTIQRDGQAVIPSGQTQIVAGDMLVMEVAEDKRGEVYDAMRKLQGVNLG
jgi:H+/Cl- antiporter ClcA